jgi:hypothetical protein
LVCVDGRELLRGTSSTSQNGSKPNDLFRRYRRLGYVEIPFRGQCGLIWIRCHLDGTEAVPERSKVKRFEPDEKDSTELKKMQLYKLNSLAMVHLIKCIHSKTCEGKVATWVLKKTASDDYPTGNAFLGFQKLKERYASKSTQLLACRVLLKILIRIFPH